MRSLSTTFRQQILGSSLLIWCRFVTFFTYISSFSIVKNISNLKEHIFSGFALIFFTTLLEFQSLFNASEGELGSSLSVSSPLAPISSLLQHGIFLIAFMLLAMQWRNIFRVLVRNIFLWGLVTIVMLSFLWSPFPDMTQRRSLAFLETCVFGIYFASRFPLKEQLRILLYALAAVGLFSLLFSLALPGSAIEAGVHAGAWRGPFLQKNLFARVMVLGATVCLAITPENKKERYVIWGTSALFITLVFLSTSKTALGLAIFFMLLKQLYKVCWWRGTKAIPFLLTFVLIVGCLMTFVVGNYESLIISAGRDPTLSGRTLIWSALIDKIQERPWLGYGYVGFWAGLDGESAYIAKAYGTTYVPPHSHNGFFELILAFGLCGVFFFGLSFLSIARRAIISARLNQRLEGLWPLIYLSFIVFYNQTESTLVEHNSIFWVIYVSLALSRFIPNRNLATQPINSTHRFSTN